MNQGYLNVVRRELGLRPLCSQRDLDEFKAWRLWNAQADVLREIFRERDLFVLKDGSHERSCW